MHSSQPPVAFRFQPVVAGSSSLVVVVVERKSNLCSSVEMVGDLDMSFMRTSWDAFASRDIMASMSSMLNRDEGCWVEGVGKGGAVVDAYSRLSISCTS